MVKFKFSISLLCLFLIFFIGNLYGSVLDEVAEDLSNVSTIATRATAKITLGRQKFSGAFVSPEGHILTLKSNLSRNSNLLSVRASNGIDYEGKVIKTWPLAGLALIKVEGSEFSYFKIGDSASAQVGDQVISLGNAFNSARGRATQCGAHYGIISGKRHLGDQQFYFEGEVFLTDARINIGSEGGPFVNLNGHLIGINGRSVTSENTNTPVNLAIPLERIEKDLKVIIKTPDIHNYEPVIQVDTRLFGSGGVLVQENSSVAFQANILKGDLITQIKGQAVDNFEDFSKALKEVSLQQLIPLTIYRQGRFLKRYLPPHIKTPVKAMLLSEAYRQAVRKAADSIVSLHVKRVGRGAALDKNLLPSDQVFQLGKGPFSGVVYRRDGYILTSSFNLAGDVRSVTVELADGRVFDAQILGSDAGRNITLLKINAKNLSEPQRVGVDQMIVGTTVLSLGRTYARHELPTVDRGVISALNRSAGKAIQIDANLTPGNFGGATIDLEGKVLGINIPQANMDSRARATAGGQLSGSGIGFVIPLWDIDNLFRDLKYGRNLEPAFLGISFLNDVSIEGAEISQVIEEIGIPKPGVTFEDLRKASRDLLEFRALHNFQKTGAAEAGLQEGDVILSFNGKSIPSWNVLLNSIGRLNAGEHVNFEIKRENKRFEIKAILGPRGRVFR